MAICARPVSHHPSRAEARDVRRGPRWSVVGVGWAVRKTGFAEVSRPGGIALSANNGRARNGMRRNFRCSAETLSSVRPWIFGSRICRRGDRCGTEDVKGENWAAGTPATFFKSARMTGQSSDRESAGRTKHNTLMQSRAVCASKVLVVLHLFWRV